MAKRVVDIRVNKMIDKNIISSRIAKIRKLYSKLEEIKENSETEYINNYDMQLITERSLQIISQAVLDIGNHLIAHHGWEKPETYRDIMRILGRNKIINEENRRTLEDLASLRNLLTHNYLTIDPKIIYKDVKEELPAIKYFIKRINELYC